MNNDQKLTTLFSMVLVISSATLGWFSISDRAMPLRIPDARAAGTGGGSEQDVLARLWEDPLQAVAADVAKHSNSAAHTIANLRKAVEQRFAQSRVGIFLVPVPGTPFADDGETRLRLRYCIQMAMAESAFAPENRDHLGFVAWDKRLPFDLPQIDRCPSADTNAPADRVILPFEWFSPRTTNANTNASLKILLLWVPEEALGTHPLCRLTGLREQLVPSTSSYSNKFTGMFLIGPRASDTLKAMLQPSAAPDAPHGCNASLRDKFSIFSPEATAPDPFVGLPAHRAWSQAREDAEALLRRRFNGSDANWRYFHNFISPDDQLTDLLLAELALRRVVLKGDDPDTVLILAEADTSYGRALPLAFQASLEKYPQNTLPQRSETPALLKSLAERSEPPPDNLVMVRYLRGLDRQKGYQTGNAPNQTGSAKSAEEAFTQALTPTASPANGESQLDYTERLGATLADNVQTRNVKAVGVLGSDLHDKLILLRALRKRFPEAVFFSTDLDAQLWHPQNHRFTRNLVIASAYGLESTAADCLGGGSQPFTKPPFRDSYQVGVFHACRAAVLKASTGQSKFDGPPQPHLYEIALSGAVRLTDPFYGGPKSLPRWQKLIPHGRQWLGILLILLAGGGALGLANRMNGEFMHRHGLTFLGVWARHSGYVGICALVLLVASLLLFGATLVVSDLPQGEPWHFGATVWPTELIRLLSVGLVVWMLAWAWQRHQRHRQMLVERFALTIPTSPTNWTEAWNAIFSVQHDWPEPDKGSIEVEGVFTRYVAKAQWRARTIRVLIGMTVYLMFGFGLMFVAGLPLNTHIRGDVAWRIDQTLLYASILALLAIIFYVLDAVCLSAQLLHRIAKPLTLWPRKSKARRDLENLRINEQDAEGYLDVEFAAIKTRETGRLLLLPFLIQFLILFSRNSYFDNWSWPFALNVILIFNMLMAAVAWVILRRAAASVRREALKKLALNILQAECDAKRAPSSPANTTDPQSTATPPDSSALPPLPAERLIVLTSLRERINGECRGAYARWIQDPAFIALLIPTGLTGVLTVLFRALFGGL